MAFTKNIDTVWLRWFTLDGELLLLPDEAEAQRADAEAQHAAQEKQRADLAEQRAERLAQLLREQGIDQDKFG